MATVQRLQVAAGVLTRADRVLVCQRSPWDRNPGKWEFPGGKVEPGETIDQCLRRELREELGIEAEPAGELFRTSHRHEDRLLELTFLAVRRFRPEPRNLCFADLRWLEPHELDGYDFLAADRAFLELARAF